MKRMTRGDDDNEKDDYSNSDGRRRRWPTNDYDDDDNYDAEEVRDTYPTIERMISRKMNKGGQRFIRLPT